MEPARILWFVGIIWERDFPDVPDELSRRVLARLVQAEIDDEELFAKQLIIDCSIPSVTMYSRIKRLVDTQLIERAGIEGNRQRVVYRLTNLGKSRMKRYLESVFIVTGVK